MSQFTKFLFKILSAQNDKSIKFEELCIFLTKLGFEQRIKGSHHIFYKEKIEEIINLQPNKEKHAKSYQVKQVRDILIKYKLGAE
jgi:predicted RNA binding protein YcfA (HicA-like mRNA interferase family)